MRGIPASLSDRACARRALGLVILSDKTCWGRVEDVSGGASSLSDGELIPTQGSVWNPQMENDNLQDSLSGANGARLVPDPSTHLLSKEIKSSNTFQEEARTVKGFGVCALKNTLNNKSCFIDRP